MNVLWTLVRPMLFVAAVACTPRVYGVQGQDWVLLGERTVTDRLDHDVIPVTIARGDFKAIKITVHRRGVDFHRVVVHFANGGDQEVEMRHSIPAGGETRAIDLRAGDRVIRSVEFWYDARSIRGRRAVVRLLGLP
jgi:hypothetical protein